MPGGDACCTKETALERMLWFCAGKFRTRHFLRFYSQFETVSCLSYSCFACFRVALGMAISFFAIHSEQRHKSKRGFRKSLSFRC